MHMSQDLCSLLSTQIHRGSHVLLAEAVCLTHLYGLSAYHVLVHMIWQYDDALSMLEATDAKHHLTRLEPDAEFGTCLVLHVL